MDSIRNRRRIKTGTFPTEIVVPREMRNAFRKMIRDHESATRESKKYTASNGAATSNAGSVVPITVNIPQGDNISQRAGNQIRVTQFDWIAETNLNGAATTERVRFIWFIDHYNLGTTPAVTDVLDSATTTSFLNYQNDQSHRFKILDDLVITMCTAGAAGKSIKRHHFFNRAKIVEFLGTTGVQGPGHFYVLVISDLGANNGTYTVNWNMRFQDA